MSDLQYRHDGKLAPFHIRLMKLLPKDSSDQLQCSIEVVQLDDSISYDALSYVWGDAERRETLEVVSPNKATRLLSVTSNLAIALRQVQHNERTLWVDSVCINQEDVQERNEQVKIMGLIYRKAQRVLVSLGQDDCTSNPDASALNAWLCMERLCRAEPMISLLQRGLPESMHSLVRSKAQYSIYPAFEGFGNDNKPMDLGDLFNIPSLSSPEFKSLKALFRNPWFHRAWTWQESFLANEKIFYYGIALWGESVITRTTGVLNKLWALSRNDEYHSSEWLEAVPMLSTEKLLQHDQLNNSKGSEFLTVLSVRRGSGCKYPSDLIYSLLGGTTRCPKVDVDYSLPFESVFTMTAKSLIDEYGDLSIFGFIDGSRQPTALLPSWVPDWREKLPGRGMCSMNDFTTFKYNTTKNLEPKVELLADQKTLEIEGIWIDTVVAIQDPQLNPYKFVSRHFGEDDPYKATNEPLQVALWRTRCRDYNLFEPQKPLQRWVDDDSNNDNNTWDRLVEISKGVNGTPDQRMRVDDALTAEIRANLDKSLFKTRQGRIGIGCNMVQAGDTVALLFGAQYPMLLRSSDSSRNYSVVGESYVHGLMNGEGISDEIEQQSVRDADHGVSSSQEIHDMLHFNPVLQKFRLI